MGIIARTVETSSYALGLEGFTDIFPRPQFLSFKDLPYLPEPYTPLLEDAAAIASSLRATGDAHWDANFVNRTQSGAFAFAGPPGFPENRPLRAPEESSGAIYSGLV